MTHIIDKVGEGVIRVRFGDHRVDAQGGGDGPAELAGACVYRHTNGDATLRHPAGWG
jgi:hypothetical protein